VVGLSLEGSLVKLYLASGEGREWQTSRLTLIWRTGKCEDSCWANVRNFTKNRWSVSGKILSVKSVFANFTLMAMPVFISVIRALLLYC